MGQLAGTTFGIGTPTTYPIAPASWGLSPYVSQGFGVQSIAAQPYVQPFSNQSIGGYGIGGAQQSLQLLQIVAQQLQQVQLLQRHFPEHVPQVQIGVGDRLHVLSAHLAAVALVALRHAAPSPG